MFSKKYAVLALLLTIYIVLTLFHPGGTMAYALPSICWATVALGTLYIAGGSEKIRSWTNVRITLMALLAAVFQIFILIDAGLVTKFGQSPLSLTPAGIATNFIMVSSTLLGIEFSRAYLAKNLNRKNPTLALAAVTLLYTFTNVSLLALINFRDPLVYTKFMGESFIPILTENLLATYLALLSGPIASLAYRAPLQAFQWFSPILPALPWGYKSLIGVMIPTIGFMAINMATTRRDLIKAGIPTPRKPASRLRRNQTSMKGWLAMSILLVLTVWASTGLLGFYPTVVASGSMTPTLHVGDMAITVSTDLSKIQVGDIIQYWQEGEMTLHRVIRIDTTPTEKLFITQGDANPISDTDPVYPNQIRGKLIFIVPKLGWISIYVKTTIANVWAFFSSRPTLAYATIILVIFAGSSYSVRIYKDRSSKHRFERRV